MKKFYRDDNSGQGRDFGRRDFRRGGFNDRGRDREMHKAICDECGKECEIPFKPSDGRPVYCSECFEKREGSSSGPRNFKDRGPRRPDFERRPDPRHEPRHNPRPHNDEQIEAINRKLDKILEMLAILPVKEEKKKEVVSNEVKIVDKKKTKVIKKKPASKK